MKGPLNKVHVERPVISQMGKNIAKGDQTVIRNDDDVLNNCTC